MILRAPRLCFSIRRIGCLAALFALVQIGPFSTAAQQDDDDLAPLPDLDKPTEPNYFVYNFSVHTTSSEHKEGSPGLGDWRSRDQTGDFTVFGKVQLREGSSQGDVTWSEQDSRLKPATVSLDGYDIKLSRLIGEGATEGISQVISEAKGVTPTFVSFGNFLLKIDLKNRQYTLRWMPPTVLYPDDDGNMAYAVVHTTSRTSGAPNLARPEKTDIESVPMVVGGAFEIAPVLKLSEPTCMDLFMNGVTRPLPSNLEGGLKDAFTLPVPPRPGSAGREGGTVAVMFEITRILPPVDLVVTAEGYDEWRPNLKPDGSPGTPLEFVAELRDAEGKPSNLRAKSFEWRLEDVSTEPGQTLNFPLSAKDTLPDLRFEPRDGQVMVAGLEGRKITRPNADSVNDRAAVVAQDWGGWGELVAVAELPDGRRVTGTFQPTGKSSVLVPKRRESSRIAESWKRKHGKMSAPDDEDDEKIDGQKDDGDGYTLYEEYRGWRVKGGHVEGDPREKDFFVLNLIGADAQFVKLHRVGAG